MLKFTISNNPFTQLFWLRVFLSILSGLLAGISGYNSLNINASFGLFFASTTYILSILLAQKLYGKKIKPDERTKLIITGLGSFVMFFFFTWILYNTLFVLSISS